jgi:hypothetical protein
MEENVPQAQSEIYFLSRELGKYTNLFDSHFSEWIVVGGVMGKSF